MSDSGLIALEARVNELIQVNQTLLEYNRALRAQQQSWQAERAKLIEKNELAKSQVQAMIDRTKALERERE